MVSTAMNGRRSSAEIVYDILRVCDNGGVNKTAIMYRSNLSYTLLKKYVSSLSSQELIERTMEGRFRITSKGQETLSQMGILMGTLRGLRA